MCVCVCVLGGSCALCEVQFGRVVYCCVAAFCPITVHYLLGLAVLQCHSTHRAVQCTAKCTAAQHTQCSAVHSTVQCSTAHTEQCSTAHTVHCNTRRAVQHSIHSAVHSTAQHNTAQSAHSAVQHRGPAAAPRPPLFPPKTTHLHTARALHTQPSRLPVPVGRHPGHCLLVTAPSAHHTTITTTVPARQVVTGPEDPQIFASGQGLALAFSSIPPSAAADCHSGAAVTQMHMAPRVWPTAPAAVVWARRIRCGHTRIAEKNWIPFTHAGDMYFVYSPQPHRVAVVRGDGACELRYMTTYAPLQRLLSAHPMLRVRGSAQAVLIDDPQRTPSLPHAHFLALLHIVNVSTQQYAHYAYRFAATPPFQVLQVLCPPSPPSPPPTLHPPSLPPFHPPTPSVAPPSIPPSSLPPPLPLSFPPCTPPYPPATPLRLACVLPSLCPSSLHFPSLRPSVISRSLPPSLPTSLPPSFPPPSLPPLLLRSVAPWPWGVGLPHQYPDQATWCAVCSVCVQPPRTPL